MDDQLIKWLLAGDVSIQYQVHRDLLGSDDSTLKALRDHISQDGWGNILMSKQKGDKHWGRGFYQPKWISSHYTLMDLRNLCIKPLPSIQASIKKILLEEKDEDGGVNPAQTIKGSDVCVNGMFLDYASYFEVDESSMKSIVDFIIGEQMGDGGYNCEKSKGATHSSLHSTISVMEGILTYRVMGYQYRLKELIEVEKACQEFVLTHRLYKSDHSGEIIDKKMMMLSFPTRWKYDILRAMAYFASAKVAYDPRMADALDILIGKRRKDGTWPVQAKHAGKVHFDMERTGTSSRWNTLRMLRIMNEYDIMIG